MSTFVVTPTLAEYAIASSVPRFWSSNVWTARSAFERGERRRVGGDRAGVADRDAFAGEERLPGRVDGRRSGERLVHDDRMVRGGGVEFLQRRQTLLGELRGVPAAHRRDELAGRNRLRARLDGRLHVGDRRRRFESGVVSRPDAEQHDVVVVVDQAGNGGAAAQVDDLGARAQPPAAAADAGNDAVLNRHLGDDRVLRVHGGDLAVHEPEVARSGAAGGARCLRGSRSRDERGSQKNNKTLHENPVRPAEAGRYEHHVIAVTVQG